MAVKRTKDLTFAIRAPFLKAFQGKDPDQIGLRYAQSSGFRSKARNAAGTLDIPLIGTDVSDNLLVGEERKQPLLQPIQFNLATNASLVSQWFFNCPYTNGCSIEKIQLKYKTAAGGALTCQIIKGSDGVTLALGTAVQSDTFNLNSTPDTVVEGTVLQTLTSRGVPHKFLAYTDRLGIRFSSTPAALAGLVVTVWVSPGGIGNIATFNLYAAADLAADTEQAFFVANCGLTISKLLFSHVVLGTDAGAVVAQVTKDTGTDAPGAGSDLLSTGSNAGFNCKSTINTVQVGTLKTTAGLTRMDPGDRLSVDFAGVMTAVAGVVITVLFEPTPGRIEVSYALAKNANLIDECFFIADRRYKVLESAEVHDTLGTDGGGVLVQLVRDKLTDAPGGGVDLLSNTTNTGFNLKSTVNTVQVGTYQDTRYNYILPGDRLALDYSGVLTAVAGVAATVSLEPA